MPSATLRTLRYTRAWGSGRFPLEERDTTLDRLGTPVPTTLRRPAGSKEALPGWIVLHGITRPGRAHLELVRFTKALAATGVVTAVPEVPEWRELSLSPGLAVDTVRAAVAGLRGDPWVRDEPLAVVGFSFGAPHAIASSGDPGLRDELSGSVGFGGYCDLDRTLRFMMTGRHSWAGAEHILEPDPYGRWIVGANYLTAVPDYADAHDVASALLRLAARAGDLGAASWDPVYDPFKRELCAGICEERRWLFDLLAPECGREPDPVKCHELAEALSPAARRVDPEIEPRLALERVVLPVHLLHGRRDHLIPFSETLRLREALPSSTWTRATVTGLFGHSASDPVPGPAGVLAELPRFLRALRSVLGLI